MRVYAAAFVLMMFSNPCFAATDEYCPTYDKISVVTQKYVAEVRKTGITIEQKDDLKKEYDGLMALYIIGYPKDVQVFCELIMQRELLKAISKPNAPEK